MLVPDAPASAAQVAKLTDFGVARVLGGDALTLTGDVLGTAGLHGARSRPRAWRPRAPADLYSLALVIYEAPHRRQSGRATRRRGRAARRLGMHLPPLRRQRRDLPRELGQASTSRCAPALGSGARSPSCALR